MKLLRKWITIATKMLLVDDHKAEHQTDHKGEGNLQHVAVHQAEQQRRDKQRHAVSVGAQRLQYISAEHHFL